MARVCARLAVGAGGDGRGIGGDCHVALRLFPRLSKRQRAAPSVGADEAGVTVCFDLGFGEEMGEAEARALAAQLTMCYAHNKKLRRPLRLVLASLRAVRTGGAATVTALTGFGWESWRIERIDAPPAEAYAGSGAQVYYLSADADVDLPSQVPF